MTPRDEANAPRSPSMGERGGKSWLRQRAKQMRAEMTPEEKAMWRLLHEGELAALNWRKQAAFGNYILDFVSHPAKLVLEIDGSQHADIKNAQRDAARTEWLNGEGYRVLRFWNVDVMQASDGVWRKIHEAASATPASARMRRWLAQDEANRQRQIASLASSSMEEAPRSGGGGAPAAPTTKPHEAHSATPLASPPQSVAGATDSSSIEEERR